MTIHLLVFEADGSAKYSTYAQYGNEFETFDQLPPSASGDLSANKLHIYHYFIPSGKLVGSQELASHFFFITCKCINAYDVHAYHKPIQIHEQKYA